MARPKSASLLQAMELVRSGETVYRAAKLTGLAQSTIARALNPPAKEKCPCCGKTLAAR